MNGIWYNMLIYAVKYLTPVQYRTRMQRELQCVGVEMPNISFYAHGGGGHHLNAYGIFYRESF